MVDIEKFKEEFEQDFQNMKQQIDHSFEIIQENPEHKKEIIDLWKRNARGFVGYALKSCEKNKDRDVFKAVSKALLFNR